MTVLSALFIVYIIIMLSLITIIMQLSLFRGNEVEVQADAVADIYVHNSSIGHHQ